MATNTTPRHTARPSRSRVTLARSIAWLDSHPVIVLAVLGALVSLILNAVLFVGLVGDGMTVGNAFSVCALALVTLALAVTIATACAEAYYTDKVSRSHSRAFARVIREHDREMSEQTDRHADTLARLTRDEMRATKERDEAYTKGAREFVVRLGEPRYWDERYYVNASVNGVDVGSGWACERVGVSSEQIRREAFSDALESATLALGSASLALFYPTEFEHAPRALVFAMPTYEARY